MCQILICILYYNRVVHYFVLVKYLYKVNKLSLVHYQYFFCEYLCTSIVYQGFYNVFSCINATNRQVNKGSLKFSRPSKLLLTLNHDKYANVILFVNRYCRTMFSMSALQCHTIKTYISYHMPFQRKFVYEYCILCTGIVIMNRVYMTARIMQNIQMTGECTVKYWYDTRLSITTQMCEPNSTVHVLVIRTCYE